MLKIEAREPRKSYLLEPQAWRKCQGGHLQIFPSYPVCISAFQTDRGRKNWRRSFSKPALVKNVRLVVVFLGPSKSRGRNRAGSDDRPYDDEGNLMERQKPVWEGMVGASGFEPPTSAC